LSGCCYRLGATVRLERFPDLRSGPPSRRPSDGLKPVAYVDLKNAPTPDRDRVVKIPHVGWNSLDILRHEASILDGVPQGAQVYFTHSYVVPITVDAAALSAHGEPFAAIVQRGGIVGVQFHPEKSGDVGLRILRNFVELAG